MHLGRIILVMCGLVIVDIFSVSYVFCDTMVHEEDMTTSDSPMTLDTFTSEGTTINAYSNDASETSNTSFEDQSYTTRTIEDIKELNSYEEKSSDLVFEGDSRVNENSTLTVVKDVSIDFPAKQGHILTKAPEAEKEPLSTSLTATYYITEVETEEYRKINANATENYVEEKLVSENPLEQARGKNSSESTIKKDISGMTGGADHLGIHKTSTLTENVSSVTYKEDVNNIKSKSGRLLTTNETLSEGESYLDTTTYDQSQFTQKYDIQTTFETYSSEDESAKTAGYFENKDVTGLSEISSKEKKIEDVITEPTTFLVPEVVSRNVTGTGRSMEFPRRGTDILEYFFGEERNDTNRGNFSHEASKLLEDYYTTRSMETISRANKRIGVKDDERYSDGRRRPVRPDPGYSRPEIDLVRPYRPDSPLHHYPYFRPTPDSRIPIIKEEPDMKRPARPNPDNKQVSYKPNFSYERPTPEEFESARPTYQYSRPSEDSYSQKRNNSYSRPFPSEVINNHFGILRPTADNTASYPRPVQEESDNRAFSISTTTRPSFKPIHGKPYHPQTSFGRPYRPTNIKQTEKQSNVTVSLENVKPTVSTPKIIDASYFNRPHVTHSVMVPNIPDSTKTTVNPSKNRPSSLYPKPSFGVNYQPSYSTTEDSVRPYTSGTVSYNKNSTKMESIVADCYDTEMKVKMRFNGTFDGLIYSSGYSHDSSCSYVNGTGKNQYEFYIRLNRCGTLGQQETGDDNPGVSEGMKRKGRSQYLVNMVTVQYNSLIEKRTDEHFRVACEYSLDYWKTVSFPVLSIAPDIKARTGNPVIFTLPPPQCTMEILEGNDVSGVRVRGPIQVGDPITLVIHMRSEAKGFDIRISNCYAHNGADKRLLLVNADGCVTEEKLLSEFTGSSKSNETTHLTLYSHLNAFRFTGSPALYIECSVHMCHNSCPEQHCNWRKIQRRSAEINTQVTPTADPNFTMSESVSLFQALEVRHDEEDIKQTMANRHPSAMLENVTCMKTSALATVIVVLLLALCVVTLVCFFNCLRMRRAKSPANNNQYVEFNRRIPLR